MQIIIYWPRTDKNSVLFSLWRAAEHASVKAGEVSAEKLGERAAPHLKSK